MRRLILIPIAIAVVAASCSSEPSTMTRAQSSTPEATAVEPSGPSDPSDPSDAVRAVDEQFRSVPTGVEDCGHVNMASGWPTTTAYVMDESTTCILEAAASGTPAQVSFATRDGLGGIEGTILGVDGPDQLWETTYHVLRDATHEWTTVSCTRFEAPGIAVPFCAAG